MNPVLSPIVILKVDCPNGSILQFREPLILHPIRGGLHNEFIDAIDTNLGIRSYGETREELIKEIHANIRMLWSEYAECADENLSIGGRGLKQRLLAAIEKIN